jgi:hypothetical protein
MAHAVPGGEDENLSHVLRELGYGFLHGGDALVGDGLLVGWSILRDDRQLAEVFVPEECFGMPAAPAGVVAGEVGGDGEEPGGEFLRGTILKPVAIDANEGFLREVLSGGLAAGETGEVGDERLAPGIHEPVEGEIIALGEAAHEFDVEFVPVACHRRMLEETRRSCSRRCCWRMGRMSSRKRLPCSGGMRAATWFRWSVAAFSQSAQIA